MADIRKTNLALLQALGLEGKEVRHVTIAFGFDEFTMVTIEHLMTDEKTEQLIPVISSMTLVPKQKELDLASPTLSTIESNIVRKQKEIEMLKIRVDSSELGIDFAVLGEMVKKMESIVIDNQALSERLERQNEILQRLVVQIR